MTKIYNLRLRILSGTIVLCVVLIAYIIWKDHFYHPKPVKIDETLLYDIVDVIDGDTFTVKIGKKIITVRMLGIDTRETVDQRKPAQCYGKESSDMTKSLLTGERVRLVGSPKREVWDKYGRYLFYVYLENEVLLNEYLIREGYAKEYTYGKPYSLQKDFKNIEEEARSSGRGMWSECYDSDNESGK